MYFILLYIYQHNNVQPYNMPYENAVLAVNVLYTSMYTVLHSVSVYGIYYSCVVVASSRRCVVAIIWYTYTSYEVLAILPKGRRMAK